MLVDDLCKAVADRLLRATQCGRHQLRRHLRVTTEANERALVRLGPLLVVVARREGKHGRLLPLTTRTDGDDWITRNGGGHVGDERVLASGRASRGRHLV